MLSNLQKNILLKYPLLWNTKFIPMFSFGVLLHIFSFLVGYFNGSIDFTKKYNSSLDETFYVILSLIIMVVSLLWLIQYFKNNAFKSFYPKSKNALFFEWFQLFILAFLLSTFYISLFVGQTLKKRSYFSEAEVNRRVEILSKADMFIDGAFESPEIDSIKSILNDTTINGEIKYRNIVYKEYVTIFGKKYSPTALINRKVYNFNYAHREQDSIHTLEVRKWLATNNQNAVKNVMNEYLKIHEEASLITNLTLNKWFSLVYNYPDFKKYQLIDYGNPNSSEYDEVRAVDIDYKYDTSQPYQLDAKNNYSKFYLEKNILNHNYEKLLKSYEPIWSELDFSIVIFYIVFGFTLLVFSFKVTSGKSWLITIVVTVLLNIIFGLISALGREELIYLYLSVLTLIGFLFTFIYLVFYKKNFRYSKVVLNFTLWFFTAIIPIIYFIHMEHYKNKLIALNYSNEYYDYYLDPYYKFLNDNIFNMFIINLIVCILAMFFFSKGIRTWKGLPEE